MGVDCIHAGKSCMRYAMLCYAMHCYVRSVDWAAKGAGAELLQPVRLFVRPRTPAIFFLFLFLFVNSRK